MTMGAVLMTGALAAAQELRVTVFDTSGAVISHAAVQARPIGNGLTDSSETNGNGVSTLFLTQGVYEIAVTTGGFSPAHERVEVTDRGQQSVSIVLKVATGGCGVCVSPVPNEPVISSTLDSILDFFPTLGRPVFASRVRRELKRIRD
jgi:hypothetical protein